MLAIATQDQLRQILKYMLDEREFLSPYGIRALSQIHRDHPYRLSVNDMDHRVDYEPAESSTGLFGGNSNWRGPIWFPVNFLLIESLQKFHYYLGDSFKVECPTGSGKLMTFWEVAGEISRRLMRIFLRPIADQKETSFRRHGKIPERSLLARSDPVPRILPWRQWRRYRREPPNGLDRTGRKTDPAVRPVIP